MKEMDDIEILDVDNEKKQIKVTVEEDSENDMEEADDYLIDDYMDDVDIPAPVVTDQSANENVISSVSVEPENTSVSVGSENNPVSIETESAVEDDLMKDFTVQANITEEPVEDSKPVEVLEPDVAPILFDEEVVTPIHSTTDPVLEKEMEKEELLEEAQSRTTRYNPFEPQQPEVSPIEEDKDSKENQNGLVFIIVLFLILIVAIFLIPKVASILG